MANKGGVITRKDIIEDEALEFGKEYAKNVQIAIDSNKVLVDSVKELNKQVQNFKVANNQKDYITAKQAEALATQQAIDAIKKQEAAEISANKIKMSTIATLEAERKAKQAVADAERKAEKIKQSSVKLTIEERVQNEILNKALKQAALEKLGLIGAYTKLNNARTEAKNKLRDLLAAETASREEIEKATKAFAELDRRVRIADEAVGDFSKNVGNYPNIASFSEGVKTLFAAFGVGFGLSEGVDVLKDAYATIKEFDQAIADLSSITGATGKDLAFLKRSAIELGQGVKGGAVQVVEAYKLIASAKPELLESVTDLNKVTEAVLLLSKASGMELPEAATALTDAMNQFGEDASQASVFVDALANGSKYGAAEIPQITDALLKFGAVAKSSNVNIQESTALIELLAEKGLKGAEAGTALRNVLLKLSAPDALPKEARREMDRLGISLDFLKDKTIPIQERLEALKPLLKDNASIVKVFGLENATAAINVIEHTDRLKELTATMYEVGTAEEQAIIRLDTLEGKTDRLAATYDSLILSIGQGSGVLSDFFKIFIDGAQTTLEKLIRINSSWDEIYDKARNRGTNVAAKEFEKRLASAGFISSTEAERALFVLQKAQKEYDLLLDAKRKKDAEIEAFNPYAINFGKSGKTLKEEKEQLELDLAARFEIIRLAKQKIDKLNAQSNPAPTAKADPVTESEADRKKRLAREKKELADRLAREKQLRDALYELEKQRLEQIIKFNDEIVADETQTDEMRLQALANSQKKQLELLLLTKNYLLSNDKIVANDRIRINEDYSNKIVELANKTQKEIDKIRVFDETVYNKLIEDRISKQNVLMNAELETENRRFISLGDLEKMTRKNREAAVETHEKAIFEIKKKYAIEVLKLQIQNLETELAASDALPEKEQLTAEKRQKIAEALSKAKLDLTDVELSKNNDKNNKVVENERLTAEKIVEVSRNLTTALSDLATAIFDRKIQNIDIEIEKNNEFYVNQIELAGNDEEQKNLLIEEREKKNKILEDKKRKEQQRQAVYNKAVTVAQIGLQTALAIITAAAATAPTFWGVAIASAIGAVELAAALATPIPKYKGGRKGGPAEFAEVGDGYVSEVIEKPDGRLFITPNKPTLTYLEEGDKVHSTVEDYYNLQRAAIMSSIDMQGRKMSDYQATQNFDKAYTAEMLEELRETRKAIQKQRTTIQIKNNIDIPHSIWKSKNTSWN